MRKYYCYLIFIFFIIPLLGFSQYEISGEYLIETEKVIDYVRHEADFFAATRDDVNGGFNNEAGSDRKSLCAQTRLGYTFSKAYALTGDDAYLEHAEHALKFLYDYGWDETNEGWYFVAEDDGTIPIQNGWPWSWNRDKKGFQQHYGLVGIASMVEVTQDPLHWEWLNKGLQSNYTNLWDNDPEHYGYYSDANGDWSNPGGKGFTATVDGFTTHGVVAYLLTEAEAERTRFMQLADNSTEHLGGSMDLDQVKFGFAENYDSDWNINLGSTGGSVGHVIKTSWCLSRTYLAFGDEKYKDMARKMFFDMWDNGGYDFEYGGVYMGYDWSTGAVDQGKDYWMLEQGLNAGLINYYISTDQADKDAFLRMADECMEFFRKHFVDWENGGSFFGTDRTGATPNTKKADLFKAGYHGVEMGFFNYTYGNLYLHKKPVDLYYKFSAQEDAREIRLNPISMEDEYLKITAVTKDGEPFTNFNTDTRTLSLAAGEGGEFKVTFENTKPDIIPDFTLSSENVALAPGDSTTISVTFGDDSVSPLILADDNGSDIFSYTIENNEIVITALEIGSGTLTITTYYEGNEVTQTIEINTNPTLYEVAFASTLDGLEIGGVDILIDEADTTITTDNSGDALISLATGVYNYTAKLDEMQISGSFEVIDEAIQVQVGFISPVAGLQPEVKLALYPNPANDFITVASDQPISSIVIISTEGRVMENRISGSLEEKINLQGFKKGVYVMQAKFENGDLITEKLIKR